MGLEDVGSRAKFLIRDRDSKFTAAFDALVSHADVKVVTTGIRIPRMNSLMERWIQTCRNELLDGTRNVHTRRSANNELGSQQTLSAVARPVRQ